MADKVVTLSMVIILIISCGRSPDNSFYVIDISKSREGENFTLPAEIFVQPTNIPVERNSDPEWQMVKNTLAWDYTPLPSLKSTFSDGILSKYSLYSTNNQFGDHTVAVTFEDKDGNPQTNGVIVQIFFNKDYLNPFDGSPDWYYYWSQSSANSGTHFYMGDGGIICGMYFFGASFFYLYDCAAEINGNTGHRGIDTFAETCLHEQQHQDDYFEFWDPLGGNDVYYDFDGNFVPDNLEPSLGFDPNNPDTDGDGHIDWEDRGYDVELVRVPGSADAEDWANPGKNMEPPY